MTMPIPPSIKSLPARIWSRVYADIREYWWLLPGSIVLFISALLARVLFSATCPFYQLLGVPCAGCGMSRAVRFLLTAQFARAFFMNPLVFVIALFIIYCLFFRYGLGKPVPGFTVGITILAVSLLVLYVVRMYLYFPNRVPYVFNYDNLMEKIVPGYRDFIRRVLRF
ncbi:MAG: DUF2752 domain-containing protein [Lachnospiraceae bacterium]|nr:DUF2752 domain-containing protein [Lachnospiraceae bacterium]